MEILRFSIKIPLKCVFLRQFLFWYLFFRWLDINFKLFPAPEALKLISKCIRTVVFRWNKSLWLKNPVMKLLSLIEFCFSFLFLSAVLAISFFFHSSVYFFLSLSVPFFIFLLCFSLSHSLYLAPSLSLLSHSLSTPSIFFAHPLFIYQQQNKLKSINFATQLYATNRQQTNTK